MRMSPGSDLDVGAIEVFDVSVPLRVPYRTAGTDLDSRRFLLVRLDTASAAGWGEAAPIPGYSPETAEEVRAALWDVAGGLVGASVDDPVAFAAAATGVPASLRHGLETAAWDALGRHAGLAVSALLGGTPGPVPVGAVLGLAAAGTDLTPVRAAGFARIKLKVDGSADLDRVAAVRARHPSLPLAIDANGSLPAADLGGLASRLDDLDLAFVEQPFPASELRSPADLSQRMATPLCFDETITDSAALGAALDAVPGAMIVLKPARLGGIAAAKAAAATARRRDAPAWVGGMLESGIGRAASLALARAVATAVPADLSPPTDYLESALVAEEFSLDSAGVHPPQGPGLGITVDRHALDDATTAHARFGSF